MRISPHNLKLVVFDMAGTTLQLADPVAGALRSALEPLGLTVSDDQITDVRGRSKREAIAALLTAQADSEYAAQHLDETFHRFRSRLLEQVDQRPPVAFPGALETLLWVREQGPQIALNTGFDRRLAVHLLQAVGWSGLDIPLACGDDVPRGRPAPDLILEVMKQCGVVDPGSVAVVGDTSADLEAAHNAGVGVAIGVLSGAHDRARLAQAPHNVLINSVADLPTVIS